MPPGANPRRFVNRPAGKTVEMARGPELYPTGLTSIRSPRTNLLLSKEKL
jgi:hypothetical protein